MDAARLIDAIVRQTTALIAQLSTAAGSCAAGARGRPGVCRPGARDRGARAWAQGGGRHVRHGAAQLPGRCSAWARARRARAHAVGGGARPPRRRERSGARRPQCASRPTPKSTCGAVLNDLQRAAWCTRPAAAFHRLRLSAASTAPMRRQEGEEELRPLVWLTVHDRGLSVGRARTRARGRARAVLRRRGSCTPKAADERRPAPDRRGLVCRGSFRSRWAARTAGKSRCSTTSARWRRRSEPRCERRTGSCAATWSAARRSRSTPPEHPLREEVLGLLARVRGEVNAVWDRHGRTTAQHPTRRTSAPR